MNPAMPQEVAIALGKLERNPDFDTVVTWFAALQADADKSNRALTGEPLFRSQGKAQLLERLINLREEAQQVMAGSSRQAEGARADLRTVTARRG